MQRERTCASKLASRREKQHPPPRMVVGQEGEGIAKKYVQLLGYRFYAKNVRIGRDEIDLIAFDPSDKVLVFIEVKTRKRLSIDYPPELGLTDAKREKMERSAHAWVAAHEYEGSFRLDLICIAGGKMTNHFEGI